MRASCAAIVDRRSTVARDIDAADASILTALRYRDFRLLWIGLLVSNLGTWMQFTAMGFFVAQMAGSPHQAALDLGIFGAARAIPVLLLLAARRSRRRSPSAPARALRHEHHDGAGGAAARAARERPPARHGRSRHDLRDQLGGERRSTRRRARAGYRCSSTASTSATRSASTRSRSTRPRSSARRSPESAHRLDRRRGRVLLQRRRDARGRRRRHDDAAVAAVAALRRAAAAGDAIRHRLHRAPSRAALDRARAARHGDARASLQPAGRRRSP